MKLPNADRAVVDMAKLANYCLSPSSQRGRDKARVFAAALGLTADDAEYLRDALLGAAQVYEAIPIRTTEYGQLYVLDFPLVGRNRQEEVVRSGWIVRQEEEFPRLTSCYVRKRIRRS